MTFGLFFCLFSLPAFAGPPGAEGDLYVTSSSGNGVAQFDGLTGAVVGEFIPAGGGLENPNGLVFGSNGNLFVSSHTVFTENITEHDGTSGTLLGTFASDHSPDGIVFGPNGNLFVHSSDTVVQYDRTTGASLGTFACGYECGLRFSAGHVFGPNGNLFIGTALVNEPDTYSISEFDGTTGVLIRTIDGGHVTGVNGSGLSITRRLTFGPNGNLFVSGRFDNAPGVVEFDVASGILIGMFAGIGGSSIPDGLVFGPNGNLFICNQGTDQILEHDGVTGAFVGVFASMVDPSDLTFKPASLAPFPQPVLASMIPAQAGNCGVLDGAVVSGVGLADGVQLTLTRTGEPTIYAPITGIVPNTSVTFDLNLAGAALGLWDVVATYPDGQTDTLVGAIDVTTSCPPPSVASFSLQLASNCDPVENVVILGEGFVPGTQVALTKAGEPDIIAYTAEVQGPGRIEADFKLIDAAPGVWDGSSPFLVEIPIGSV